jgi:hypothetical protein
VGDLDDRTTNVRQMQREGFNSRFFYRYHIIKVLSKPLKVHGGRANTGARTDRVDLRNVSLSDFKFEYVFDMAMLLWPNRVDGRYIKKFCDFVDVCNTSSRPSLCSNLSCPLASHFGDGDHGC